MKTRRSAYRSTIRIVLAAGLILLLPLVAMQFTDEVVWSGADFFFAGVLLVGTGLMYELAARKAPNIAYRAGVAAALAAAFILIWLTGAVGIIGSEENDANLMYFGVLAVGIIGAIIARVRPHGLAVAMLATALAQVVVAVIALIGGLGATGPRWPWDVVGLTGIFVALWLVSGWLFRRAALQLPPTPRLFRE
jgi:hypothetical protein